MLSGVAFLYWPPVKAESGGGYRRSTQYGEIPNGRVVAEEASLRNPKASSKITFLENQLLCRTHFIGVTRHRYVPQGRAPAGMRKQPTSLSLTSLARTPLGSHTQVDRSRNAELTGATHAQALKAFGLESEPRL